MTTPNEIYIQTAQFYVDDIKDDFTLDEFIELIKNHFVFSNPDYKHKVVPYKYMKDGGDYNDDYEEVEWLDFITYRYETEEERINRENEEKIKEEERLAKAEETRLTRDQQSIEWSKKDSINQIKKYFEIATEFYSKEELKEIIGL